MNRERVSDRNTTASTREHGLIAIKDLRVCDMTARAAGTVEEPATNMSGKSASNRSNLERIWSLLYCWTRRHIRCRFRDGVADRAITYAGISMLSKVLKEMSRQVEAVMEREFWQIAAMWEISLVFAGTWILVNREALDDICKTCGERNRRQLGLRHCADTSSQS